MKIRIPALLIAAILPLSFAACKPDPIQPPSSSPAPVSSEIPETSAPEEELDLLLYALKEGDPEQIWALVSLDKLPDSLGTLSETFGSLPAETKEKISAAWKELTAGFECTLVSWDLAQEDHAAAQLLLRNRDFSEIPARLAQEEDLDSLPDVFLQQLQEASMKTVEFPIQLDWTKQEGQWKAQANRDLLNALSGGMLDQVPFELLL